MEIKELAVQFTDTAEDEVNALVQDLRLAQIASFLQQSDQPLPEQLKVLLTGLIGSLVELFSVNLPEISEDPEQTLRMVSRDINLSRLLRERGMFRLYRLTRQLDQNGVPLFMGAINPTTGAPFSKQEEFIGWFCAEAHVTRSLTFMRFAAIDRAKALGFDINQAFEFIIKKPYAVQETLHMLSKEVLNLDVGDARVINPDMLLHVAERIAPDQVAALRPLADAVKNGGDADDHERLATAARPVLAELLEEVAAHPRAKDALDMVRHDILLKPEISYAWDEQANTLVIQLVRRTVDTQTGQEIVTLPISIPFVPDAVDLPEEIKADLLRRLPIRNRAELD